MNKIKSRRVRRARRRGKYTTRKGYRKYKKHYTRKYEKRIQGKLRMRRQTRRKDGGGVVLPSESQAVVGADVEAQAGVRKADTKISTTNLTTEDIKTMLRKIKIHGQDVKRCVLFCEPDSCSEDMLQKIKERFIEKAPNYGLDLDVIDIDAASVVLAAILDDSLLFILENLCDEYDKTKEIDSITQCKSKIDELFKRTLFRNNNILHHILKIFFNNIGKIGNDNDICIKNLKLLLELLNSMTHHNTGKLENVLKQMTAQNIEKMLNLLKSMTPESILKLLTDLAILDQEQIKDMLDTYNKLNINPESMAQLLELYSFIEKSQNGEVLIHRYVKGETPFSQRLYRNEKHQPKTCKAVTALHNQVEEILKEGGLTFQEDEEFQNVLAECNEYSPSTSPEVVTGGGRKRKTLKKKRGGNSKR
jgi:hypothetical protein